MDIGATAAAVGPEGVNNPHLVPRSDELVHDVRAYEPRTAGY
jgi:hypothetical protein